MGNWLVHSTASQPQLALPLSTLSPKQTALAAFFSGSSKKRFPDKLP